MWLVYLGGQWTGNRVYIVWLESKITRPKFNQGCANFEVRTIHWVLVFFTKYRIPEIELSESFVIVVGNNISYRVLGKLTRMADKHVSVPWKMEKFVSISINVTITTLFKQTPNLVPRSPCKDSDGPGNESRLFEWMFVQDLTCNPPPPNLHILLSLRLNLVCFAIGFQAYFTH